MGFFAILFLLGKSELSKYGGSIIKKEIRSKEKLRKRRETADV
jgi:hypothetical protein